MTAPRQSGDILFLGDSLIEFYDWESRFPHHRIRNLGVAGETVEWLFERLPVVISTYPEAEAVFIMSGINNLAMEQPGFMTDYRKIIAKLKATYPGISIFIHTLLPTLLPWIDPSEIVRVNGLLKQMAAEEGGVRVVDMHGMFIECGLRECLIEDGIHISKKGYELWADVIETLLLQ